MVPDFSFLNEKFSLIAVWMASRLNRSIIVSYGDWLKNPFLNTFRLSLSSMMSCFLRTSLVFDFLYKKASSSFSGVILVFSHSIG